MFVCLYTVSFETCASSSFVFWAALPSLSSLILQQLESRIFLSKHLSTVLSVSLSCPYICKYAGGWTPPMSDMVKYSVYVVS